MPLVRRFTLLPDQKAALEETRKTEEATVPVEEPLAIEVMVPETPAKTELAEAKQEEVPVPEKVKEEPAPVPEVKAETPEAKTEESEVEEPKVEEPKAEETPATEPAKETPAEEPKKAKRTKKTTKKTEPAAEEPADEPAIINVTTELKKKQDLQDAVAAIMPNYEDAAFDEFKAKMEEDLLRTAFDEQADAARIKIILSSLSRCYDNAAKEYAKVNTRLERLTNKTYGLITRQIILNSNGANEISRKQNGVRAPEMYTAPNGETANLYAVQAGLEAEAIYLQMVMKKLEYKRSTLISFLTANKLESELLGD